MMQPYDRQIWEVVFKVRESIKEKIASVSVI